MTTGPQTCYRVRGGYPLQGTVFVQGAKNAALKMIAASLLADKGRTVLRNVPVIEDVRRAVELAQAVGAVVKFHEAERTLVVDASELTSSVLGNLAQLPKREIKEIRIRQWNRQRVHGLENELNRTFDLRFASLCAVKFLGQKERTHEGP